MSFGKIILDPEGDTIEIDASSGQEAVSRVRDGRSVIVDDGYSGKLTCKCDGQGETIRLIFPDRVLSTDNDSPHYINGFYSRSGPTNVVCQGKETIELHIGGLLHIKKKQPYKEYTFEIPITIECDHP